MPFEYGLISPLYSAMKDFFRWFLKRTKKASTEEIIGARQRRKEEIETHLRWIDDSVGYGEAIIRDIKRVDSYPDVHEKGKGISSWFRVALLGTYHRGLQVGLRFEGLKYEEREEGWRYYDYKSGEIPDLNACLVGQIPFERIVNIDWEGDEYYSIPHIYCHFTSKRKEPYEALVFCEKKSLDRHVYYPEIATYENVRKLSKKLGKGFY